MGSTLLTFQDCRSAQKWCSDASGERFLKTTAGARVKLSPKTICTVLDGTPLPPSVLEALRRCDNVDVEEPSPAVLRAIAAARATSPTHESRDYGRCGYTSDPERPTSPVRIASNYIKRIFRLGGGSSSSSTAASDTGSVNGDDPLWEPPVQYVSNVWKSGNSRDGGGPQGGLKGGWSKRERSVSPIPAFTAASIGRVPPPRRAGGQGGADSGGGGRGGGGERGRGRHGVDNWGEVHDVSDPGLGVHGRRRGSSRSPGHRGGSGGEEYGEGRRRPTRAGSVSGGGWSSDVDTSSVGQSSGDECFDPAQRQQRQRQQLQQGPRRGVARGGLAAASESAVNAGRRQGRRKQVSADEDEKFERGICTMSMPELEPRSDWSAVSKFQDLDDKPLYRRQGGAGGGGGPAGVERILSGRGGAGSGSAGSGSGRLGDSVSISSSSSRWSALIDGSEINVSSSLASSASNSSAASSSMKPTGRKDGSGSEDDSPPGYGWGYLLAPAMDSSDDLAPVYQSIRNSSVGSRAGRNNEPVQQKISAKGQTEGVAAPPGLVVRTRGGVATTAELQEECGLPLSLPRQNTLPQPGRNGSRSSPPSSAQSKDSRMPPRGVTRSTNNLLDGMESEGWAAVAGSGSGIAAAGGRSSSIRTGAGREQPDAAQDLAAAPQPNTTATCNLALIERHGGRGTAGRRLAGGPHKPDRFVDSAARSFQDRSGPWQQPEPALASVGKEPSRLLRAAAAAAGSAATSLGWLTGSAGDSRSGTKSRSGRKGSPGKTKSFTGGRIGLKATGKQERGVVGRSSSPWSRSGRSAAPSSPGASSGHVQKPQASSIHGRGEFGSSGAGVYSGLPQDARLLELPLSHECAVDDEGGLAMDALEKPWMGVDQWAEDVGAQEGISCADGSVKPASCNAEVRSGDGPGPGVGRSLLDNDVADPLPGAGCAEPKEEMELDEEVLALQQLAPGDLIGELMEGMEQDVEYVRHIILLSGFATSRGSLPEPYSRHLPLYPSLFETLEEGIAAAANSLGRSSSTTSSSQEGEETGEDGRLLLSTPSSSPPSHNTRHHRYVKREAQVRATTSSSNMPLEQDQMLAGPGVPVTEVRGHSTGSSNSCMERREDCRQRMLLFDAVNEALGRRLAPFLPCEPWEEQALRRAVPGLQVRGRPTGMRLLQEVWAEIHDWPVPMSDEVYDVLDKAARRDMAGGVDKWRADDLAGEDATVVGELEASILSAVVEELAKEMVAVERSKRVHAEAISQVVTPAAVTLAAAMALPAAPTYHAPVSPRGGGPSVAPWGSVGLGEGGLSGMPTRAFRWIGRKASFG